MEKSILLLSCCAPCSCAVIEAAARDGGMTVLFYNPNIRPHHEYLKRLQENRRVCETFGVPFIAPDYEKELWDELTKGLHDEPERGKRCDICFYMRLKKAMRHAKEHGFAGVASVLAASRHKDPKQVARAAAKASAEEGLPYIDLETRKNGMQERRFMLIKELSLYNQTYCGCKPL